MGGDGNTTFKAGRTGSGGVTKSGNGTMTVAVNKSTDQAFVGGGTGGDFAMQGVSTSGIRQVT